MATRAEPVSDLECHHPCVDCAVRERAVCGVLEPAALRAFKEGQPTVHYAAGETVVFEADVAANVYSLTSGLLRLSKLLPDGRRQIAGFLFPGDFLGMTMEVEHAFTAEAVAASTLCKFSRRQFDSIIIKNPALERRLYAVAANELAAARQQLVLLGRKTATERIASFLLMLAGRCHSAGGKDDIGIPMSRADIADYLGLRLETVSRESSALKAARVIQLTGRQSFRIVDRDQLRQFAESSAER
jgi:CRP/FNR family transcriptional regulator